MSALGEDAAPRRLPYGLDPWDCICISVVLSVTQGQCSEQQCLSHGFTTWEGSRDHA